MNRSFLAPTAFTAAFVLACPLAAQSLTPAEQVVSTYAEPGANGRWEQFIVQPD